jgi:hypothetical protein
VRDDELAAVRFYLEPVERESGDFNAAVRDLTPSEAQS